MQIAYFDEVKYSKSKPYYWLGALIATPIQIRNLELKVNDLSEEIFGSRSLAKENEFHASHVFNGNGVFEDWDWEKKFDLLSKLIEIINSENDVGKIYVRINVNELTHGSVDVETTAFMYLVERIESYLRVRSIPGLLIGDRESDHVSSKFAGDLSHYKECGTTWSFGRDIKNLIDTVHFTHSHHSRMIQLADAYVYFMQFLAAGDNKKAEKKQLIEYIRSLDNFTKVSKCKIWP
jgi:hypothetical protein